MTWLSESFDEVRVVVFTLREHDCREEHVSPKLSLYPTNSRSRILYIRDAIRTGRRLGAVDVASAQDPFESGLAAYFLAKILEARFHVQIHTDFLSPAFCQGILNRIRLLIASFVIPRADCTRAVSTRIHDSVLKKYPEARTVVVLPVFVDVDGLKSAVVRAPQEHPEFSTVVLVISRLERERNVALAIESFAEAFRNRADVGLVVVGSGRESGHLQALADALGIRGRVRFEGQQQDVAPYYAYADVVLNTSDYEGYGRVIVEALACGVPVVSTDVGIAREAGAVVVSPEDFPGALRETVNLKAQGILTLPTFGRTEYRRAYYRALASCIQNQ